jgi:hypothetical protein
MNEGTLNTAVVNSFNSEFEQQCVSLLSDAYIYVQSTRRIDSECKEEYISAVLFDHIDKSPQSAGWHIDIAPEYRKHINDILKGKKLKKAVPPILMTMNGWENNAGATFFVKAQRVTEALPQERKKEGSRSPIIISDFHKRYVATMDSCLSGNAGSGCIVSYIFQGDIRHAVNCLNHCLCDFNRVSEILSRRIVKSNGFDACYVSMHGNRSIKHLMFNFSDK